MFQMLSLSKQRNCPSFLKLCLGDQTKETKMYYRIVHFYYLKCFQLLLKRKGNARLFPNFVRATLPQSWRGASRRKGQPVLFTRSRAEAEFRLQDETSTTDIICVFLNETSILSPQNLDFDSVRHGAARGSIKKHW